VHKPGAWTPVYISVINNGKYDPDPKKDGPAEVVVEVTDCDDTAHNYSVPLPPLKMGDQADLIAWHKQTGAKRTFLVHGEEAVMRVMATKLEGTAVEMPTLDQAYDL